ncbi:chorismate-binding protein [Solibacillus sp. CAU 1738]|uniref:chorismate-binding protein n=1 Tax=Solibacillus sp. CAU 1738 TaxID=3140363 RepID=UPI00325FF678
MQKTSRTTMRKVNGDCLTPVLIFNRLQGKQKFLLESSAKHETAGRYSFIGVNPRKTYSGSGTTLTEISHPTGTTYSYEGDLIQSLKRAMPRISQHTEYPFTGGAIGFIKDGNVLFQVYNTVVIFDHVKDELILVHTNIEAEQQSPDLDALIRQITQGEVAQHSTYTIGDFVQRQAEFFGDPFAFYRDFRVQQPAAYLYYIELAEETLIGASAESLLNVKDEIVTTTIETVIEGTLLPTLHAIDTVMQAATAVPNLLGYIGFNGQIDFTNAQNTMTLTATTAKKGGAL